jgi:putative spermidine/putrescine transport system ATP-binding protein
MVRISGVTYRYGGAVAVDDVSFEVERGAFLTILGPSGSGKTTLLRMIAGFLAPESGKIDLDGQPVVAVPPYRRSIGMVFQRLALFPNMTVRQNVAYPLKMRRFPAAGIAERVDQYLALVRLEAFADRPIQELSGGQQQRVAIARALVFEPDLLLLDEPLASLDRQLREEMQLEFRRIQQDLAVTAINVTHDQREALVMSDEIIVMNHGRIQQMARPVETYRNPVNQFVAGFIGVTNLLPGRLRDRQGGRARVDVGNLTLGGRCALGDDAIGAEVDCAIRAEQIRIADPCGDLEGLERSVEGQVQEAIFEGDRMIYAVSCSALGGTLRVTDHNPLLRREFGKGETVRLAWRDNDLMIFERSEKPAAT